MSAIANRLKKNWDKLKPWASKLDIEAFRLYDRDIPEYPSIIEVFGNHAVLWDRRDDLIDRDKDQNFHDTIDAVVALGIPRVNMVVKRRARQAPRGAKLIVPSPSASDFETRSSEGDEGAETDADFEAASAAQPEKPKGRQYSRRSRGSPEILVREGSHKFLVNLHDYLDTGLFLDHRLTRKLVADHVQKRTAARLGTRFLNLFCYTGSFSVYAARAGATVTSVDMSPVYLAWAERNFASNNLMTSNHRFINDDVLSWMKDGFARKTGPYDFIFCDPPTFSNSKKMEGTWDVERDHKWLIEQCLDALSPDGVLIFSANRRDFKLDESFNELEDYKVRELTRDTLPKDFHDAKARRVYLFS